MTERLKKIYHSLSVLILVAFALIGAFVLRSSYVRLFESVRDFALSFAYFHAELFKIPHNISPTVVNVSSVPFYPVLGFEADELSALFASWVEVLKNPEAFTGYLTYISVGISKSSLFFILFIYVILVIVLLFKLSLSGYNVSHGELSKPLKAYLRLSDKVFAPLKVFSYTFFRFFKERKVYRISFILIWLLNVNAFTLIFAFFAYFFYFFSTFNVASIFVQIYKLIFDVVLSFRALPVPVWLFLAYLAFNSWRKNIAYTRLNHFEMKNRGFINSLPVSVLIVGTMGKGKTTLLVDMALSASIMFRDEALCLMLKNNARFPHFPWLEFEKELRQEIENRNLYTLALVEKWVYSKFEQWRNNPVSENVFGYDVEKYGIEYNNGLELQSLWKILVSYSKEYFIFILMKSLIISNFSIREDDELLDMGNFPLLNSDFFKRDPSLMKYYSIRSNVLDFDCMRLGKLVLKNNPNADFLEFGVVAVSEIGKELGNQVTNKGLDKNSEEANALNDGFDLRMKLSRHAAMVDNKCFFRMFSDEQRPESLGADVRELCDIVNIDERHDEKIALPFFFIFDWFFSVVDKIYNKVYPDFRYRRGDDTLFIYALKTFHGYLFNKYEYLTNTFGYVPLTLSVESGKLDGNRDKHSYVLCKKKIYSARFTTDAFAGFFKEKVLRSKVGLIDQQSFGGKTATNSELNSEHSYCISKLNKVFADEEAERAKIKKAKMEKLLKQLNKRKW